MIEHQGTGQVLGLASMVTWSVVPSIEGSLSSLLRKLTKWQLTWYVWYNVVAMFIAVFLCCLLCISLELVRLCHSQHISSDMYMTAVSCDGTVAAKPRTVALSEELGQIRFILSDKTGTLTQVFLTYFVQYLYVYYGSYVCKTSCYSTSSRSPHHHGMPLLYVIGCIWQVWTLDVSIAQRMFGTCPPLKWPFQFSDVGFHHPSANGFSSHMSLSPKWHLDWLGYFCIAHVHDQYTGIQTTEQNVKTRMGIARF